VDLVKGANAGIWLQENKTKADIDAQALQRQLTFDLQTMLYLTALDNAILTEGKNKQVQGVRYNVIRRPLSGGQFSIRQHKPSKSNPDGESTTEYYNRLGGLIAQECADSVREKRDNYFFMRWNVHILPADLQRFQREFLNPFLEDLCVWWDAVSGPFRADPFGYGGPGHYRYPYGVYNPLLEGRSSDLDQYVENGSMVGLEQVTELFTELK
jgi:hypothetical protein